MHNIQTILELLCVFVLVLKPYSSCWKLKLCSRVIIIYWTVARITYNVMANLLMQSARNFCDWLGLARRLLVWRLLVVSCHLITFGDYLFNLPLCIKLAMKQQHMPCVLANILMQIKARCIVILIVSHFCLF